jgi:hypothetical protein
MKYHEFNEEFSATAGCLMHLAQIYDHLPESKTTIKADAWLGSVRCAQLLAQCGHSVVLQIIQTVVCIKKSMLKRLSKMLWVDLTLYSEQLTIVPLL